MLIICLPITLQLSLVTGRWYGKKDFWILFDDSLGVELCEDVFVIAISFGNNIKQHEILPCTLIKIFWHGQNNNLFVRRFIILRWMCCLPFIYIYYTQTHLIRAIFRSAALVELNKYVSFPIIFLPFQKYKLIFENKSPFYSMNRSITRKQHFLYRLHFVLWPF